MSGQPSAAAHVAHLFGSGDDPAPRRVLVVDDELSIRTVMAKFLKSRGYDVAVAESGAAALDALASEPFDAMLCDVRMPGMSGAELVPRAIELRPGIAVLMLTAVDDASTASAVLAHGAMDYLMKPIELDVLAKAAERALRKRDLAVQRQSVERTIHEEVARRTEEFSRERALLAKSAISLVSAVANVREAKDPFLRGHSQRVAAMSAAIASVMGLPNDTIEDLRLSGELHDIGKIGVPEELPRKPSPLTGEEYTRVSEHVRIGVDILSPLAPLARALPASQDHHEWWDGSGYPRGLAGEQISLGGRILAAVDAFDAMTSGRAYREPLTLHATIELLSNSAGTQFDPAVVAALRRVVLDRTSLHFSDEAH